jgi:hypothetical protein
VPWFVIVAGLMFPGVFSLVDCWNREVDDFVNGADDRRAWLRWLGLAVPLCLVGVGYGIVLGYYYGVVRRNSPMRR